MKTSKNKSEKIQISTEFIKLDQLMKWANLAGTGAEAKFFIHDGKVKVNGETEMRRGRKIYPGDKVSFENSEIIIEKNKR